MEDQQILDLFWERKESAITETEKKYGRYCHYIAYQILNNDADAKEITNDISFKLWNTIPPKRPTSFKTYIGMIARQLSLDRYDTQHTKKRSTHSQRKHKSCLCAVIGMEVRFRKLQKNNLWIKITSAAACLLLVAGMAIFMILNHNRSEIMLGGISLLYKDIPFQEESVAYEWKWEYQYIFEQYTTMIFQEKTYRIASTLGNTIDSSFLGEKLGTCKAVGIEYRANEDIRHEKTFDVYRINSILEDRLVAVEMEGLYYIFHFSEYIPPRNFGQLLEEYSLSEHLHFSRLTHYDENKKKTTLMIEDDSYIWQILYNCRDAVFSEQTLWTQSKGEYISFTATSEVLGCYKKIFYVTTDGHIQTNIFDYAYTFNIGTENAQNIISYVLENSKKATPEPYTPSLAGTVTAITNDSIVIDDTILCVHAEDGMRFTVLANDIRIKRYIESGLIHVGDTVMISFRGTIDTNAENVVKDAYSLAKIRFYGGDILIPE